MAATHFLSLSDRALQTPAAHSSAEALSVQRQVHRQDASPNRLVRLPKSMQLTAVLSTDHACVAASAAVA